MKKRYTALRIKLSCIMVAIILLGTVFFTLFQAVQYEKSTTQYKADWTAKDTVSENEEVSYISRAYDMFNSVSDYHRTGFYGALISPEGETVVETCDFVIVEKCSHDGENTDRRILLLEEDFLSKGTVTYYGKEADYYSSLDDIGQLWYWNWTDMEITGTCDLNYIYPEKIKITITEAWKDVGYVEYVPHENKAHLGTVTVAEWLDGHTYVTQEGGYTAPRMLELNPGEYQTNFSSHSKDYLNRDSMDKWLDKEAKKISQKLYEQTCIKASEEGEGYWFEMSFSDSYDSKLRNYSLFIKYDYYTSAYDDTYGLQYVFVYHPILMVMEDMWMVYIIIFLFTLISLMIISVLIKKAYKQQLVNETNRRDLTRGIAHELKTPLAITRGYVENWEYLPEEDKEEITRTMMSEMDHMNKMVTDLLELSHMEAGMKTIQWEEVDLYSLASSILKRMKNIISERDLDVKLIPEAVKNADAFVVDADLEMIRIAMSNFISNAVKYAEKEVTVTFSENNKKVRFEIENDGSTIDSEEIKKVWDEFYKSDSVNRSTIGSSGLGLAITKNIFILHNAEYGCNNENGKVKFFFEIKKER